MNPEHQTFILFKDWGSIIAKMSVEEKAAIFDALFSYTKGEPYTVPSSVSFFFEFMIEQIEKNDEKWTETQERCKNAGRLGGLAKSNNAKQRLANSSNPKQPLAPLSNPKQPLATPSNNVNVNVNANVNDNVNELSKDNIKEIDSKESIKKSASRFLPPSYDEVASYCLFRNNNVDPQTFIDFYTSKGWKVGNQPMKDWKAAVRTWEKREDKPKNTNEIVDAGAYFQSLVDKEAN